MCGLGVPTTLHGRDVDWVSEIFIVGGGERIKLGSSAVNYNVDVSVSCMTVLLNCFDHHVSCKIFRKVDNYYY